MSLTDAQLDFQKWWNSLPAEQLVNLHRGSAFAVWMMTAREREAAPVSETYNSWDESNLFQAWLNSQTLERLKNLDAKNAWDVWKGRAALDPTAAGRVTVTRIAGSDEIVLISIQDEEHRILKILWEKK